MPASHDGSMQQCHVSGTGHPHTWPVTGQRNRAPRSHLRPRASCRLKAPGCAEERVAHRNLADPAEHDTSGMVVCAEFSQRIVEGDCTSCRGACRLARSWPQRIATVNMPRIADAVERRDNPWSGRVTHAAALSTSSRLPMQPTCGGCVLARYCDRAARPTVYAGLQFETNYGWPQVARIPGGRSDHVVRC